MFAAAMYVSAQSQSPLAIESQYPNDDMALTIYDGYTQKQLNSSTTAVRTTWIANRPKDNWFFSLYGGIAALESEESRYRDLTDRIHPTVGFALGKWFSPVWGLRLNASAAKLQGFAVNANLNDNFQTVEGHPYYFMGGWMTGKNYTNGAGVSGAQNSYTDGTTIGGAQLIYDRFLNHDDIIHTDDGNGYSYDITYAGATVDFLLNLKNLFTPYNHKALFNPVLYAGVGYAHTFGDKDKEQTAVNSFIGRGGLQLNFRLHDRWDFFIDGGAILAPEYFDRRVGDNMTSDFVYNVTAGLTYRFNFRHFMKAPVMDPSEIDALNRQINELRNRPVIVCPPVVVCPEPEVRVEEKAEKVLLTPVFFTLDSYVVRDNQLLSIAKAAQYLLDNPKAKIQIAAYADKNTGNPAHNWKLSQNRSNAVANVLVDKFGITRSRLDITFFGDKVQPFDQNDWNRVAIFIVP